MSRRFQEKNKDLISLDVVSSDKVWDKKTNAMVSQLYAKLMIIMDA